MSSKGGTAVVKPSKSGTVGSVKKAKSAAAKAKDDNAKEAADVQAAAMAPPKGKKRERPPAAPAEPPPTAEPDPEESGSRTVNTAKRKKKARLTGYRKLAAAVGYHRGNDVDASRGLDAGLCLTSKADAKRLCTFVPITTDKANYTQAEVYQRLELRKLGGLSSDALRETQVRIDHVLKETMNRATLRITETAGGSKTITAQTMLSVLRPYAEKMQFTSAVPPLGVVRHAQAESILSFSDQDKDKEEDEKKAHKDNRAKFEKWEVDVEKQREKRRARLAQLKAEREAKA